MARKGIEMGRYGRRYSTDTGTRLFNATGQEKVMSRRYLTRLSYDLYLFGALRENSRNCTSHKNHPPGS
jgi:hypothetical protein